MARTKLSALKDAMPPRAVVKNVKEVERDRKQIKGGQTKRKERKEREDEGGEVRQADGEEGLRVEFLRFPKIISDSLGMTHELLNDTSFRWIDREAYINQDTPLDSL